MTVASAVPRHPGEREPERPLCERTPGGIGACAREAHRSALERGQCVLLSQTGNTENVCIDNAGRDERTFSLLARHICSLCIKVMTDNFTQSAREDTQS